MSIQSVQTKIHQINKLIIDLSAKENTEKTKRHNINAKIFELTKKILSTKSFSTIQSYERQRQSKEKEVLKIEKNLVEIEKKLLAKRIELSKAEQALRKELEKETKKKEELEKKRIVNEKKVTKEREQANKRQIQDLKAISNEIKNQQNLFSDNIYKYRSEIKNDEEEYNLEELVELNHRIDDVLKELNKLGLGQDILFQELEELKNKGKKISKKDLKLMLIGKIVSFGMKSISTETAQSIFYTITGIDMSSLLE